MPTTTNLKKLRTAIRIAMVSILILASSCDSTVDDGMTVFSGPVMGTGFTVKIAEMPEGIVEDEIEQLIQARLEELEQRFSTYRRDSEISRIKQTWSTSIFVENRSKTEL